MDPLKQSNLRLASGTETAAALIIALAAIEATARSLALFVRRSVRAELDRPARAASVEVAGED